MARKSTRGPDWFDLANYESLRHATLRDWLVELTNRLSWFSILSRARADERYRRGKGHAFAMEGWNRIRRFGSLTGAQREAMSEIQARLSRHPLFAELTSIEAQQRWDRETWLAENGQSNEQGSTVTRLTKGDVMMRFLIAGELEGLAREVNETDTFPEGILSPMPMDAVGTTQGENSGFVRVDLHAPDAMIRADFDDWLASRRQMQASKGEITPRMVSQSDFDDWCKFQVLPYLDLTFAMKYEGFHLSQEQIGASLFPEELDVSLAERIRKVTRPKAVAIFTDSFLNGLQRQYVTPLLNERND